MLNLQKSCKDHLVCVIFERGKKLVPQLLVLEKDAKHYGHIGGFGIIIQAVLMQSSRGPEMYNPWFL